MPKGEYDTPGPFWLDDKPGFNGAISVYRNTGLNCHYLGSLSPRLDQAEREELCGLLNKGTHYDAMLAALKSVNELWTHSDDEAVRDRHVQVAAAIAAAEGKDE